MVASPLGHMSGIARGRGLAKTPWALLLLLQGGGSVLSTGLEKIFKKFLQYLLNQC